MKHDGILLLNVSISFFFFFLSFPMNKFLRCRNSNMLAGNGVRVLYHCALESHGVGSLDMFLHGFQEFCWELSVDYNLNYKKSIECINKIAITKSH